MSTPELRVTPSGHHIWDEWAVEEETAVLLYGVVKAAKPELVVECGTGNGYATSYLLGGLTENGKGRLVTFEPDDSFRTSTSARFGDSLPVEFREGTSKGTDLRPDLVFVDTYGGIREEVVVFWLTHPDRPLTVIHDACRNYPFHLGEGVHIPGHDGLWIGRAKPVHSRFTKE